MSKDYFSYNNGAGIVPENSFRISASQVSRFFDETSQWFRDQVLKEEGFQGNTATELGTCVHAGVEMIIDTGEVQWDSIRNYVQSITNPEVDKSVIEEQMHPMLAQYESFVKTVMPVEAEKFVYQEIMPGYGVGGSIDALKNYENSSSTIYDWKTTSKSHPTSFSRPYWFQQMTYAWVLKQQGVDVRFIKLVFVNRSETNRVSEKTGKPLKNYPSQLSILTEEVTPDKLELIEGALNVIAESVKTFNEQPELRHIIAQDSRLKQKLLNNPFNQE